jgi:hypothetical protein
MLDACRSGAKIPLQRGYWISKNAPGVKSRNIQHPGSGIQDPGSRNIFNGLHKKTLITRKHFPQPKY